MSAGTVEVVPAARVPGPRSSGLRLVPGQVGPELATGVGDPLVLGRAMRARLLGAVRALVDDPALADASDGARLASVVLAAKASVRDGYRTRIWAEELGRWLGVSQSQVAHTVLPELRRAGVLGSRAATDAAGHVAGLECWVVPLYRAQRAGYRRHALALSRSELAVLLRLCEALFGPGWTHRDGSVTAAGLLAGRRGRGAATDRLGLLLMVLSSNSAGWLRLCPGTVDSGRGRPAATVARLLGCSPAAGAKVLRRLEELGPVRVERRVTGSGLHGRSRVCVVPVAEARGAATAAFSDLAATASGDLETGGGPEIPVNSGVSGAGGGERAGTADLAATAQHHTDHASVADVVGDGAGSDGFSGVAPSGCCARPECACPREDQAARVTVGGRLTLAGGSGGPLRRDKPEKSAADEQTGNLTPGQEQPVPTTVAGLRIVVGGGSSGQRQARVSRPPRDLETVFGGVGLLWARLERSSARHRVVKAARRELAAVADITGQAGADRALGERLMRRLAEQGGPAAVKDPVGWLLGRGLPQRGQCADPRCDDGLRLDHGGPCETCAYLVGDRRALRRSLAAQVDTAMPRATAEQRRAAYEQLLRATVSVQHAEARERHESAVAERKRRAAARERGRAQAEAAERARLAEPCARCGRERSAGLCGTCAEHQVTEAAIRDGVDHAVAAYAHLQDPLQCAAIAQAAEAQLREAVQREVDQAAAQGASRTVQAVAARLAAQNSADTCRASAFAALAHGPQADAEARLAFAAGMRRARRCGDPEEAAAQAETAARQARERTAQHLLAERLTLIRERRAEAEAAEWTATPTKADAATPQAMAHHGAGQPPAIPAPATTTAAAGQDVWSCVDCGRVSERTRPAAGRCLACERRRLNIAPERCA